MTAPANDEPAAAPRTDEPLAETAREERDYLRERLRTELGREPSNDELDEWLREHTEGY